MATRPVPARDATILAAIVASPGITARELGRNPSMALARLEATGLAHSPGKGPGWYPGANPCESVRGTYASEPMVGLSVQPTWERSRISVRAERGETLTRFDIRGSAIDRRPFCR